MTDASVAGDYDIVVIGGGINGCGIARDAAGRGFKVLLAEMNDLASGTSSVSTKLVHGGLRYLEFYKFGLVREALIEREVLWSNAPHIIRPLRFVLPHHEGLRPRWLLRTGLFVYDHLGGRRMLPPTRTLDLRNDAAGRPLKAEFTRAFEYSDCWVDDSRLVVLNARDAADRDAEIRPRTEVTRLAREGGCWRVTLSGRTGPADATVRARLVVNAAGPWVDHVLAGALGDNAARNVRLVQGSHIVLPRLYDHERCYFLQNSDGRIVFAIPYEDDFTLIGTTDQDYAGDPGKASISRDEIDYLCTTASAYFRAPVAPSQIVWTYSGVRPLYDDGASKAQEATREYVLKQDGDAATGALINVFGGKITTYRKLAEQVLEMVEAVLGQRGAAWTADAPLPGGDFAVTAVEEVAGRLARDYPFLDEAHRRRLVRTYGTLAERVPGRASRTEDLGRHFGADLYEAEVRYLVAREWAVTAEDVLWRRTKRGLKLDATEAAALDAFMAAIASAGPAEPAPDPAAMPGGEP